MTADLRSRRLCAWRARACTAVLAADESVSCKGFAMTTCRSRRFHFVNCSALQACSLSVGPVGGRAGHRSCLSQSAREAVQALPYHIPTIHPVIPYSRAQESAASPDSTDMLLVHAYVNLASHKMIWALLVRPQIVPLL